MPTVAPKTQLGLKIIPMATKPSFTLKYDLMNLVVATFVQKLCRRWLNLSGFTIGKELRRIGSHFKASQLSSSSSKNIFQSTTFCYKMLHSYAVCHVRTFECFPHVSNALMLPSRRAARDCLVPARSAAVPAAPVVSRLTPSM